MLLWIGSHRGEITQLMCNFTALDLLASGGNCTEDGQFYCFGLALASGREIAQRMFNFTALGSCAPGGNCTVDVQFYCFGYARSGEKLHS